jgi:hypothetical protein
VETSAFAARQLGGTAIHTIASGVAIPGYTWKIAVIVPVRWRPPWQWT